MTRRRKTKTHGNTIGILYISKVIAKHNGKTLKELIKIGIIKKSSYPQHKLCFDKIQARHRNSIMSDLPSTYQGKKVAWQFHLLGTWENRYKFVSSLEEYFKANLIDYREDLISRNQTLLTEYFGFENKNCRTEEQVERYIEYLIDGQIPTNISSTREITLNKDYY